MTVTGIHLIGDRIQDVFHKRQQDYGALVVYSATLQYEVPVCYGAVTMTVTGVDFNRDGMPGVLQQPQVSSAAPVQRTPPHQLQFTLVPAASYGAPAPATYGGASG